VFKVSQSKVKTWRRCKKQYDYKYNQKLKRKKVKRPFMFGRIVHEMVEANANGDDPFEVLERVGLDNMKLFSAEREMYGEIIEDIRLIMTAYFDFWPDKRLTYIRRGGRNAEHEFEIEIEKGILLVGKIDAVGDTENKLRWLVEHKSFGRSIPNEDHRWRNLQSAVYLRVISMLGWFGKKPMDGVLWDYIWSKPPTIPPVLADKKTLSSRAIDTVPPAIIEELKRLKLSPKDNAKVLTMAQQSQTNYFQRIFTPVSPRVVDEVFQDFVDTAREMYETADRRNVYPRNIERHCEWCDFEPLCRATLQGNDVDYLIEREYTKDADPEEPGEERAE